MPKISIPLNRRLAALHLIAKGIPPGEIAKKMSVHHPGVSLGPLQKAYFPAHGLYSIQRLRGASPQKIRRRAKMFRRMRDLMVGQRMDPEFRKKMVEAMTEAIRSDPKRLKRAGLQMREFLTSEKYAEVRKGWKERMRERTRKRNIAASKDSKGAVKTFLFLLEEDGVFRTGQYSQDSAKPVLMTTRSPDREIIAVERQNAFREAFSSLSENQRRILELAYLENSSIQRISRLLRLPEKEVEQDLWRAVSLIKGKHELRELLKT